MINQRRITSYECGNGNHGDCSRDPRRVFAWQPVCECACHEEKLQTPRERQNAVTCHTCGAPVESDALAVQTAVDGTPRLHMFYCAAHLVAGLERLKAAIRAQQAEGGATGDSA